MLATVPGTGVKSAPRTRETCPFHTLFGDFLHALRTVYGNDAAVGLGRPGDGNGAIAAAR
jgi:hypothetical protein